MLNEDTNIMIAQMAIMNIGTAFFTRFFLRYILEFLGSLFIHKPIYLLLE